MSRHKAHVSVAQMADAMQRAIDYVGNHDPKALDADIMRREAIVHALQVVGEAARRLPPDLIKNHPGIDWSGCIGLLHRITHGYDTINTRSSGPS